MNKKKLQIKYSLLQGLYWGLFGITISFVNSYLYGLGLDTDLIGISISLATALAALCQMALGKKLNSSKNINWNNILKVLLTIRLGANLILMTTSDKTISLIMFGIAVFCLQAMLPFVNLASFDYEEEGIELNFGLARGFGSLFFAGIVYVLGSLVAQRGIYTILLAGLIVGILMFIVLISMPASKKEGEIAESSYASKGLGYFYRRYPSFMVMQVAFILIMAFHNNVNAFLLQVINRAGGGNKELGVALFIAALCELPIMFFYFKIREKLSSEKLLQICSVFFVIKGLIFYLAKSIEGVYLAQFLQLLTFAIFISASVYYAKDKLDAEDQAQGQTLVGASSTIGSVVGSLSGGFLIKNFGMDKNLIFIIVIASLSALTVFLSTVKDKRI